MQLISRIYYAIEKMATGAKKPGVLLIGGGNSLIQNFLIAATTISPRWTNG